MREHPLHHPPAGRRLAARAPRVSGVRAARPRAPGRLRRRPRPARAAVGGVRAQPVRARARAQRRRLAIRDIAGTLPVTAPPGVWTADAAHPIFTDEVRYVGQPVALVLAESRAAAVDAAERVDVEWEELPPTPPEPMRALREDRRRRRGRVRRRRARRARAALDPAHGGGADRAARRRSCDGSTVWISAQDTYRTRRRSSTRSAAASTCILPDVGGAFGSKGTPGPEIVAVAAAAQRARAAGEVDRDPLGELPHRLPGARA